MNNSIIRTLSVDELKVLLKNYIDYYKSFDNFKDLFKDDDIFKTINVSSIKTVEDLDKVLSFFDNKYKVFLNTKDKFFEENKNFSAKKYLELKEDIRTGAILNKDVINKYRGLNIDSIIDEIIVLINEMEKKYSKKIIKKSKENTVLEYRVKIEKKLREALRIIKNNIIMFYDKYRYELDIDIKKNINFIDFYKSLVKELEHKTDSFIVFKRDIDNIKRFIELNESKFLILLNKVGIDYNKLSKEDKDELLNITVEEIEELISEKENGIKR